MEDTPAYLLYHTLTVIQGLTVENPQTIQAYAGLLADVRVQALLEQVQSWEVPLVTNHKNASLPWHSAHFLLDLGVHPSDLHPQNIFKRITIHRDAQGPFQVLVNIPKAFGGNGQDQWAWMLCDAPLQVELLVRLGFAGHLLVVQAVDSLVALVRENGYPCCAAQELGKFHGPGRREDPCPYANLLMLRLLSRLPDHMNGLPAQQAVESHLSLWANRREQHPYLFHMGTDFTKLKAPFIWYDLLHTLEVLSRFDFARTDPRLRDMLEVIHSQQSSDGSYAAGSVWLAFKNWDFGQKKTPSPWITSLVRVIESRFEKHSSEW
jgi:hypothetical protein